MSSAPRLLHVRLPRPPVDAREVRDEDDRIGGGVDEHEEDEARVDGRAEAEVRNADRDGERAAKRDVRREVRAVQLDAVAEEVSNVVK